MIGHPYRLTGLPVYAPKVSREDFKLEHEAEELLFDAGCHAQRRSYRLPLFAFGLTDAETVGVECGACGCKSS